MCNACTLRHRAEAILDLADAPGCWNGSSAPLALTLGNTTRWLHPLTGRGRDLEELRHKFRSTALWVHDEGSQACLCGEHLDDADTPGAAYKRAKEQLALVNEALAAWVDGYLPVQLASAPIEILPDGARKQHVRAVGIVRSSAGARLVETPLEPGEVPAPTAPERMLGAAALEPHLRAAMALSRGSFADLCRAVETIKRRGIPEQGATKKGGEHIQERGWLTIEELADLNATCLVERHGLPSAPPKEGRVLPLPQARTLVRRLLDRWSEEILSRPTEINRALEDQAEAMRIAEEE